MIKRTCHFRSPNSRSDDLDGSRNLHWDSFDNQQKYLEIGKKFTFILLTKRFINLVTKSMNWTGYWIVGKIVWFFRSPTSPVTSLPRPQDVHLAEFDTSIAKNGSEFDLSLAQFPTSQRTFLGRCEKFQQRGQVGLFIYYVSTYLGFPPHHCVLNGVLCGYFLGIKM